MNRKSLIVGLSIAAAAAAASAESYTEYNTPVVPSSAARVVVQSRDIPAIASVTNPASSSYDPIAQFRSDRDRGAVTSEYVEAREVVSAFTGEDSGSGYLNGRPAAAGETFAAIRSVRTVR